MAEPAHARLSPSGSKRWFACPGSVTLEAPFPDTANTYSDDGTAMHDVAAWCLTTGRPALDRIGEMIAVHRDPEPPRHVEFTDEMADLTQGYVDTVRALAIGNELHVEQRVDFSTFVGFEGQFGTADAIIWNARDGEMLMVDLKTGYRFVDAEENSQLLLYALGALKQVVEGAGAARPASDEAPEGEGAAPTEAPAPADEPAPVPAGAGDAEADATETQDELW